MPQEFAAIFYGIYVIFGKKNQRKMVPEGPTSQAGAPYPPGRAGVACGQLLGRLVFFFRRKKANFRRKILLKFQPDRSYGSPWVNKTVKPSRFQRREIDRKFQDPISGEALAPGRPKTPWTRGGTLLPSRGKAKQEEEGGGPLSPSLPVAPECRRGNNRDGDHLQQLRRRYHHIFSLSIQRSYSSLTPL